MMTPPQQRATVVTLVDEAVAAGARRSPACRTVGINVRTLQRWRPKGTASVQVDQRPLAQRAEPPNKLSEAERQELLKVCNQPDYASLPPSQIVPKLADAGHYIASESTFYRTLKAHNQLHHRGVFQGSCRKNQAVFPRFFRSGLSGLRVTAPTGSQLRMSPEAILPKS